MHRVKQKYGEFMRSKYKWIGHMLFYLFLVTLTALFLYWRYPNNVDWPNYYGEDGSVYLQNILDKGWLAGTFSPFNGYSIIGLYIICGLGWIINLFIGGSLLTLPVAFAIAAILFMASIICLPYILFKDHFGKIKMLAVVLLGALVPLPVSPHTVIGTIGNQKWIFLYLAFLLVLYRIFHYKTLKLKQLIAIDLVILICAYTNSAAYILVPLLLLPYVQDYLKKRKRISILKFVKNNIVTNYVRSLILLCLLLLPQVIYVAINGIPRLANYLDTPFKPERAVELFVNRTYLYGITHEINDRLSDISSIVILIGLLTLAWFKLKDKAKIAFFTGIYAAGAASVLFVINRPGVTDHFFEYSDRGSGPDQFFYAQTLIMYLPLVLLVFGAVEKLNKYKINYLLPAILVAFVAVSGVYSNANVGERWRNASVYENDAGTFIDQAIESCSSSKKDKVTVIVYPYKEGTFNLKAEKNLICDKLHPYQNSADDLGLTLNNNDHIPIQGDNDFTQTFTANKDGLNGIRIYVSSFGKIKRVGEYKLVLLNETCSQVLRESKIPTKMIDNSYYNARFDPITYSKGDKFCFSLQPMGMVADLIALQVAPPNKYLSGVYTAKNQPSEKDLLFFPLYSQSKP